MVDRLACGVPPEQFFALLFVIWQTATYLKGLVRLFSDVRVYKA